MPIVTIQITREGTTPEQKAALIKGATDLLANVLHKSPGLTFVIIQEVELEETACPRLSTGVGPPPGHLISRHRTQAVNEYNFDLTSETVISIR